MMRPLFSRRLLFLFNSLLISFTLHFSVSAEYGVIGEDLFLPAYDKPILEQNDFFQRNDPKDMLIDNRVKKEDYRVSPNIDVSMFSDDLIQTADLPLMTTPRRYGRSKPRFPAEMYLPSQVGPTGLIDSISGRGLPQGKYNFGYLHNVHEVKSSNVFRNVNNFDGTDILFLMNYGLSDNFELHGKVIHTDRSLLSNVGTSFDSAENGLPEFAYGLKIHQEWLGKEIAVGFINSNIARVSRNLILDQDFEAFKSIYLTVTSDITHRTESNITLKRNSSDQKFAVGNSWMSFIGGIDTALTKKTHLIGEMKYEDYSSPANNWSINGGLRHQFGTSNLELFMKRANQQGYSSLGFKVSGAF